MRSILLSLILASAAVAGACAQLEPTHSQQAHATAVAPVRSLTAEAALADVALMRRALETIHPGLHRYTSRPVMDDAFARLERSITGPLSDAEFYRRLSLTLALIHCTHTKAEQPKAIEDWRDSNPSHLPFRFRIVEGRMLVVSSDPSQTQLPRGAEVLSINGRTVADLIKTLGAYVPVDGDTEWSRAAYLAHDGDLMGSDFDHFYPYVFSFPTAFDIKIAASQGTQPQTIRLVPVAFRDWLRLDNDGVGYRENFSDSTEWRVLEGNVGYLKIGTFVNYRRPADAPAVYRRALGELQAAGARSLIVDLRENGGGSNDAALALIDALAREPYIYQRAVRLKAVRYGDLPNFISTWGDREELFNPSLDSFTTTPEGQYDLRPDLAPEILLPRSPVSDAFQGRVTVLTGPANASGATMVIAKLKDMGRVTLVGAPSGGSAQGPTAGTIFNVALPNSGIAIRVPLALNLMEVANPNPRGGISPDIEVRETVEDFRKAFDRTLAIAIADQAS